MIETKINVEIRTDRLTDVWINIKQPNPTMDMVYVVSADGNSHSISVHNLELLLRYAWQCNDIGEAIKSVYDASVIHQHRLKLASMSEGKEIVTVKRETEGKTNNGNDFGGKWVARKADGTYIDHDRYRHDLRERLEGNGYFADFIGD